MCKIILGNLNTPVIWIVIVLFNISQLRDFPGGAEVGRLPANAGDVGSSPGPGRYRMPPQLLSLRATTTEARVPRAFALQQEKPPQWDARAPQGRVAPAHCN